MIKLTMLTCTLFGLIHRTCAQSSNTSPNETQITIIDNFDSFENNYINNQSEDTIFVYNFWATWCKPCIQELPYFDSLNTYSGQTPIHLVLVSLDFKEQIETTLIPFVKANKITNEIVVLTDEHVNTWIDKVDSTWSGAIPATLIIKGDNKLFYEKTFHSYNELLTAILNIKQ